MLTNYILIQLNGKPFNCVHDLLLVDLLAYLNVEASSAVVEYNSQIVQESLWGKIVLKEGDKIELLTIVGGG